MYSQKNKIISYWFI